MLTASQNSFYRGIIDKTIHADIATTLTEELREGGCLETSPLSQSSLMSAPPKRRASLAVHYDQADSEDVSDDDAFEASLHEVLLRYS